MTLPKVTVIMNTFREKPEWLSAAVNSYINQRGVDVELIISYVDGDPNIMPSKFAPGIKLVRNEKPGIYQQINATIPHITGDFVCYASSNDMACDTKLIQEVERCLANKKAVCYSDFYKCDANLKHPIARTFQSYNYNDHLNKGNFVSDCALVRTDIFRKYTPFKTEWNNAAYHDLWLRIYEGEGDVFVHNPKPTWYYRFHDGSKLKRQNSPKLQKENRENRERMIAWHKSHFFSEQKSLEQMRKEAEPIKELFINMNPVGVIEGVTEGETHFVYVYVQSPARWNELAISVQSIRKHFQGKAKFFCVGAPPMIKDVTHIAIPQVKGRGCKPKDALEKLKAIANCPLINEDFIYCYDDVILLRPITAAWFNKTIAVEHVPDFMAHWNKAKGVIPDVGWRALFTRTFTVLTKKKLPTWNWETHLPRKMSKVKITQTIERFGEVVCGEALFSSLYFNQHYEKPDILLKENTRIKAGLHRAYDNPVKIISEIKGRVWLNFSDPFLNELAKKTIKNIVKGEIKV